MDPDDPDASPPPGRDLSASPHDAFFKSVFSQPEHAVSFFRKRLPASIATAADWTSLTVVPGSFVKPNLPPARRPGP